MDHAARTCMKRRLLYAASQAYQPQMEVAARCVGWIEPPLVVRREGPVGHRAIDLALVGRVAEGVVVAFRGTLPPFFDAGDGWAVVLDWLNDGLSLCVERAGYPGGVHLGFAESADRLWADRGDEPGVQRAVAALLERSRADGAARRHLFVTGHSKGGALANLTAWRAAGWLEWRALPVSVATFAAARAGNAGFARAYEASRIACLRYEVPSDLVPHLPPGPHMPHWAERLAGTLAPRLAAADYRPVGLKVTAGATGRARGDARWTGTRRALPRLLGRRGAGLEALVPPMLRAHAICPGSAYDRLVCSGEDCDHGVRPGARGAG